MVDSKAKGNAYERELVKQAKESGLPAERAYASNGRALGEVEGIDLLVADQRIQAKIRAGYPKALVELMNYVDAEGIDASVFRMSGVTKSYVLLDWFHFLDLLKRIELAENLVE